MSIRPQDQNDHLPGTAPDVKHRGHKTHYQATQNDFVFKRYQLEENHLFKDTTNYKLPGRNLKITDLNQEESIIDDELVIVPMDLDGSQEEEEVEESQVKKEEEQGEEEDDVEDAHSDGVDVFVFDDDLEEEEAVKPVKTVQINPQPEVFDDFSVNGTSRNHQSQDQMLAMSELPKKQVTNDPNLVLPQLFKPERYEREAQSQKEEQEDSEESDGEGGLTKIKGVQLEKKGEVVDLTITDKKVFSMSKLPSGIILQCILKRTSSLLTSEFDLYLSNGLRHVVSAKKYPFRNRELFRFSTDPVRWDDKHTLAIMHANSNHNIYWLLDPPRRIGTTDFSYVLAVVGYYRIAKNLPQRKFTAVLPPTNHAGQYELALDYDLSSINFNEITEEMKMTVSNLQEEGQSSSKNFALAEEEDQEYKYLEMRKESDDVFHLTVQHPLSPLQAMAIAMTRFDAQLK